MPHPPPPWKGTKYGRFWADSMFSGPSAAWFKLKLKKKKDGFQPKKTLKISKKLAPKTSDTVKRPSNPFGTDLWDRGSICICILVFFSSVLDLISSYEHF